MAAANKSNAIRITRIYDAPVKAVWEAWTDPQQAAQWWGPRCFTLTTHSKMYGRAEYLQIEKPDRLTYNQQFCDENEKVSRHPMAPTWPETTLTTARLFAEGPDRTRVSVTWEPYGATTREELETFIKSKGGMTQGWTGSFDKLDAYLAKN